jgi:hypothetical protein
VAEKTDSCQVWGHYESGTGPGDGSAHTIRIALTPDRCSLSSTCPRMSPQSPKEHPLPCPASVPYQEHASITCD